MHCTLSEYYPNPTKTHRFYNLSFQNTPNFLNKVKIIAIQIGALSPFTSQISSSEKSTIRLRLSFGDKEPLFPLESFPCSRLNSQTLHFQTFKSALSILRLSLSLEIPFPYTTYDIHLSFTRSLKPLFI